MFSATLMLATQALRSGDFGEQAHAVFANLIATRLVVVARDSNRSSGQSALSGQHLHQLLLAVAGNTGNPQDLAGANAQAQALEHRKPEVVVRTQVANLEHRIRADGLGALERRPWRFASHHQLGQ